MTSQTLRTGLPLSKIVPQAKFLGGNIRVSSCSTDAEACQPGDLYIAIENGASDGHDAAFDAIENGATAIVGERILPVDVPQCIVPDSRIAFGHICHALSGSPTEHLHSIGVTGTYGKTITEFLIVSILEAAGHTTGALGSLGYSDGLTATLGSATTPDSGQLVSWLQRMQSNGCSHCVIEASSEALARKQLSGIHLSGAVITNIHRDHMNIHRSLENYRSAKASLLQHLKPGGFAVMNADDAECKKLLSTFDGPLLTFSLKHDADITATVIERHKSEQTFLIEAGSDSMPVRTHMIGDHHVQNCLAAAAVGLILGIDLPTIAQGLETIQELPGRLQRIECGQDYGVFVNCETTPEGIRSNLLTLQQVTQGRLICVTGPQQFTSIECARLGGILEAIADEAILTEDVKPIGNTMTQLHDILDGFDRPAMAHLLPDRAKAICWALGVAQKGDTILISGAPRNSHAQKSIDDQRFFDRDVVKYWLKKIGSEKASPWIPA